MENPLPPKKTEHLPTSRTSANTGTKSPRAMETAPLNFTTTGQARAGAAAPAPSKTGAPPLAIGSAPRIVGGIVRSADWTPVAALNGLISDPRGAVSGRSPAELFRTGLPIAQALATDRRATKILLLAELGRLWRSVKVGDAKTWTTQDDLQDVVDDICDVFRTLKIEEVLFVFQAIRRGEVPLFGRLDTPTLFEALRKYEAQHTTTYRENYRPHLEVETAALDVAPARAGQLTVREAFARIAKELPTPTKTLEQMGRATIADLRAIAAATDEQQTPTK